MTPRTETLNRELPRVLIGVVLGFVAVIALATVGRTSEPPDTPVAEASGVVHKQLRDDCELADPALLSRLYGKGKAVSSGTSDDATESRCTWSDKSDKKVEVELGADLEDYPKGGEVAAAAATYRGHLENVEEGDPAHGLAEPEHGLGDEAYARYDPADGSAEFAEVEARSGNVVVDVRVHWYRRYGGRSGHDALVGQARRIAASVLARTPR